MGRVELVMLYNKEKNTATLSDGEIFSTDKKTYIPAESPI